MGRGRFVVDRVVGVVGDYRIDHIADFVMVELLDLDLRRTVI